MIAALMALPIAIGVGVLAAVLATLLVQLCRRMASDGMDVLPFFFRGRSGLAESRGAGWPLDDEDHRPFHTSTCRVESPGLLVIKLVIQLGFRAFITVQGLRNPKQNSNETASSWARRLCGERLPLKL